MNGNENLESRVLDELRKTGFPTEIVSASLMAQYGWGIVHNLSYLDDREKTSREFDIRAFQAWEVGKRGATEELEILVYLITECKRSDKPWVFFSTNEVHDNSSVKSCIKTTARRGIFWTNAVNESPLLPFDDLKSLHHYFLEHRRARTYYEPLRGQEKSEHGQMLYPAIMSATKATLFHLKSMNFWPLALFYPLIIFNGQMFDANVLTEKDIEMKPTEYIQVAHHYTVPSLNHFEAAIEHEFVIDVVTPGYLRTYLMQLENEHRELARLLSKPYMSGLFPNR